MYIFIKDHDYDVWKIISNRDFLRTSKKGDKVKLKLRSEDTKAEAERVVKNYRV